jgi:S1-C subfamily serine protease
LRNDGIRFDYFQNDNQVLTRSGARDAGLSEGDAVFVLGFPLGLVGKGKNFVIVRQGAIARIRDCLEAHQKNFLIDCSIFPGNSGGPIIIRPEIAAIEGTKNLTQASLIGVAAGYVPYRDVAISAQTGNPRITFEENSGLASVFPIDYIEEVIAKAVPKDRPLSTEVSPAST